MPFSVFHSFNVYYNWYGMYNWEMERKNQMNKKEKKEWIEKEWCIATTKTTTLIVFKQFVGSLTPQTKGAVLVTSPTEILNSRFTSSSSRFPFTQWTRHYYPLWGGGEERLYYLYHFRLALSFSLKKLPIGLKEQLNEIKGESEPKK